MNANSFLAEIIAVGDEVLCGRVVDTNSAFLSRELQKLGLQVKHKQTVADLDSEILAALHTAVGRSNVIVFCGGLGPTDDDLTKQTICGALNLPLTEDAETLAAMQAFFESRGAEMTENNRKQALVPVGGRVLKNENGTAPGICIQSGPQAILMLPGPPHEMEPMFLCEAVPLLQQQFCRHAIAQKTLRVTGIGESALEQQAKELLYGENPHTALYAKRGEVEIVITAEAADADAAQLLCENKAAQFRQLIGDSIFSEDGADLAQTVVRSLASSGSTVALAESFTGGMAAKMLTDVSGSYNVFEYGVTAYADWAKVSALDVERVLLNKHTAISSVAAAEMARGARRNGRADYGVGITGLAGPSNAGYLDKPVGLVYIAVCDKKRTVVRKFQFGNKRSRDDVRRWAAIAALDMLRRFHLRLPIEGEAEEYTNRQIADMSRKGRLHTKTGLAARKALVAVLGVGLTLAMSYFGLSGVMARENRSSYIRLAQEHSMQSAQQDQFQSLTALNSDTAGWLQSESGAIDTVVMLERNDVFYAGHDFYKEPNLLGCAALLTGTQLDARPQNLVITASCDGKDVQFAALPGYLDAVYAQENACLTFSSPQYTEQYRVFAAFLLDSEEGLDDAIFRSGFEDEESLERFVINAKMRSVLSSQLDINSDDRFLTLVCDYAEGGWQGCRLVVVARQLRSGETLSEEQSQFAANTAALYPAAWYAEKGIVCNINAAAEADKWLEWFHRNSLAANEENTENSSYMLKVLMNGELLKAEPIEVVSRMVAYRVDDDYSDEAIKAVAVASATSLKRQLESGDALPEVAGSTPSEKITAAVAEVINEVLVYDGALCWTPMFYCSSGSTNDASWMHLDGSYPYLQSVVSPYDYLIWSTGYHRVTTFSADTLRARLESYYEITLSQNTANWIQITERTPAGYVTAMMLDGQIEVEPYSFFTDVLALPSAHATVNTWGTTVSVTTYGTGYGVGMSITGAQQYVEALGWGYESILGHYYIGAALSEEDWQQYISA